MTFKSSILIIVMSMFLYSNSSISAEQNDGYVRIDYRVIKPFESLKKIRAFFLLNPLEAEKVKLIVKQDGKVLKPLVNKLKEGTLVSLFIPSDNVNYQRIKDYYADEKTIVKSDLIKLQKKKKKEEEDKKLKAKRFYEVVVGYGSIHFNFENNEVFVKANTGSMMDFAFSGAKPLNNEYSLFFSGKYRQYLTFTGTDLEVGLMGTNIASLMYPMLSVKRVTLAVPDFESDGTAQYTGYSFLSSTEVFPEDNPFGIALRPFVGVLLLSQFNSEALGSFSGSFTGMHYGAEFSKSLFKSNFHLKATGESYFSTAGEIGVFVRILKFSIAYRF